VVTATKDAVRWEWKAQECDFLPVYRRLEGFFELIVANAQHMKAVSGRKTDVQDADWIADLLLFPACLHTTIWLSAVSVRSSSLTKSVAAHAAQRDQRPVWAWLSCLAPGWPNISILFSSAWLCSPHLPWVNSEQYQLKPHLAERSCFCYADLVKNIE
jgi:hypothetical protein